MKSAIILFAVCLSTFSFAACAPIIKMQAPDKPLEVNMNVKIEHTVRVKVDKQLDNVMSENDDIF